jgi:6-phosphofructokinase
LNLDGIVIIGATHSLSDGLLISDYLVKSGVKTRVITVPCTVDNNIGHHMLEAIVGFDTASKIYSQLIGNIMIDAASAVKYWYFIRLMGRDPSHLVLECALQTQPNITIISE